MHTFHPTHRATVRPVHFALFALLALLLSSALQAMPSKSDRLILQNQIDKYEDLDQAFFPWAHNAYNATDHGATEMFKNQDISVTDQLNAGQRLIDLDPQWSPLTPFAGFIRLCHNFCIGTEQLLTERIQDIKDWFDADPWRYDNEVVVIFLETYNHNMFSTFGYRYNDAISQIDGIMGGDIYKPHHRCHAFENLAGSTTKADILAAGKNIILIGSGQGNQGQWASCTSHFGDWGDWVFTLEYVNGEIVDYVTFDGYPHCSGTGFSGQSGFSSTYNDIVTGGGGGYNILPYEIDRLMECGVNAVSVEPFVPENNEHEALIWSWKENEPNAGSTSDASCALHTEDGLEDADCSAFHRYACRHMDTGGWKATQVTGPWSDGSQACYDEFGADYAFSVPTNGYQSRLLRNAAAGSGTDSNVFDNYNDLSDHGDWQPMQLSSETTFDFHGTNDGERLRNSTVSMKFTGLLNFTTGHDGTAHSAIDFGAYTHLRNAGTWGQKFGTDFTIRAWFKSTQPAPNDDRHLVLLSDGGHEDRGFGILMQPNGELRAFCRESDFDAYGQLTTSTSSGYLDGQWHQVVYVHSEYGAKLYVDGEEQGYTSSYCSNLIEAQSIEIGTYGLATFPGAIDDVAIYGYSLPMGDTSARIRARYNNDVCLQKIDSGWNNGNTTALWDCDDRSNEYKAWEYEATTGYFRSAVNPSKCLHKRDTGWNNGNPIVVDDCDAGTDADKSWDYNASSGRISAQHNSSKCFHKKFGHGNWNNGNPIHLWSCSAGATANKTWDLD